MTDFVYPRTIVPADDPSGLIPGWKVVLPKRRPTIAEFLKGVWYCLVGLASIAGFLLALLFFGPHFIGFFFLGLLVLFGGPGMIPLLILGALLFH